MLKWDLHHHLSDPGNGQYAMAHQEPSTLEFLMNLSHNLRGGESLADALVHAEEGAQASASPEQANRLQEKLDQMRAANRASLARLHPDDGV